ncbi:hypothetical protein DPMN_003253 [Dreissena polymorpha]|uniref:Uncharacterized protein n=1 Tax=Dreissena polymorpha TaxID=45954 RepID=A0A9D4MN37_DREPO|nr:hypothetical protein DPMN_003253 [Dreissena polymorpha]
MELFNYDDPLRPEVRLEELGVRGGEGSSWTVDSSGRLVLLGKLDINAGALLKTTSAQWAVCTSNKC